jgi:hypothetical protein
VDVSLAREPWNFPRVGQTPENEIGGAWLDVWIQHLLDFRLTHRSYPLFNHFAALK